jgi:prephenate dehydrogenase
MPIRQITIVGTGLIGGSFALALKKHRFAGRVIGCDRAPILERARKNGVIDHGYRNAIQASRGSQVVLLATPVGAIMDLVRSLGPALPPNTLLADVGSTKSEILACARQVFGTNVARRFLAGHPMAGKEQSGVESADPDLFQGAAWFVTPSAGQKIFAGLSGEFVKYVEKTGARIVSMNSDAHDQLCAWISHLPQMISTALAAALVEEYGEGAPLLDIAGRGLRQMTRLSASPYSMWRDVSLTNKDNLQNALWKLEQRLAHIRENLDSRELAAEFEQARRLHPPPPRKPRRARKND